jgi:hypothetical protein
MASSNDNILAKEIESFIGLEYTLRRQYAEPFNKMLKECLESEDYAAETKPGHKPKKELSLLIQLLS